MSTSENTSDNFPEIVANRLSHLTEKEREEVIAQLMDQVGRPVINLSGPSSEGESITHQPQVVDPSGIVIRIEMAILPDQINL